MITTHLILFFFNTDGGTPPTPSPADVDAPILLVRFAKMGIR